ncbi:MAG TPA: HAMP domain-containing sensor histidine kinase [Myxococcales bacterium]|nr:HAMP domain-containing sensor histidine kinase [Myxococcales bacterium]
MEQRRDSPTPTYAKELAAAQQSSIRVGCLVAASLLVAFFLLDKHYAPQLWVPLLGVRATAAVLLGICSLVALRTPPMALATIAVAITAGTIEVCILRIGPGTPYLYAMMLVQAGLTVLLPLRPVQALWLNSVTLAITVLPLISQLQPGMIPATSFLAAMAFVCVCGALIQDRLRRREHQARAEFARHFGLVNLGALAGGLAHELGNPLSSMGLQIEMLEKDPGLVQSRIAMLRRQTERMKNILEAMRNGAKIGSGEQRLVDLTREADLAFTLLESKLRGRASLVRAYADVPPVMAQPTLLGQVLVNLLTNAADAVAGRPESRIALRVRKQGDEAWIEVEDDGPGIPEENAAKIFEPFFSTKGDQGNGLGLWISSEIARMHGGSLTLHKGVAGGALFRLTLPIPPGSKGKA